MYSPISAEPLRSSADSFPPESLEQPFSHDVAIELPVLPGQIIAGKYRVIQRIGAGGMGQVFSAMHLDLGERVALKFLRREALAHPELVQRFATEARAAARIRSEHVARVFDVGHLANGVPFIVMEFLEGQDLSSVLAKRGALPIELAVGYMLEVCEALASAHAKGIVHRDIKPENLFLTRTGQAHDQVKVLDFGVSKLSLESAAPLSGERRFVQTTLPVGSPAYMSPEQIRDCGEVDQRTDIWSLGCALFELLTGKVPFDAPTLVQLGAAILEQEPIPLRRELPGAPIELEAILSRCLSKDANARFGDVAELARALSPFASERARIYAERCRFLLPGAEPQVEYERFSRRDSIPSLTRDPSTTVPAIGRIARAEEVDRKGSLRSTVMVALALAALAGSYVVGRQTRAQHEPPTKAVAALAAPELAPTPPALLPRAESLPAVFAAPTPAEPVRAEPKRAVRAGVAAPRSKTLPRAKDVKLAKGAKEQQPKSKRVFGQAPDESFDVGY